MRYLLDVNALLALGLQQHVFHERVAQWVENAARDGAEFGTCAITELGFLRILMQAPAYGFTVEQGRRLLAQLKKTERLNFAFVPDDQEVAALPGWVKSARQITDGHLAGLAEAHGLKLVTLDRGIRGAFVIPPV